MADVEDKVAFITGGDSGIGLGISQALSDAGMKIMMTYRSQEHLDEAMSLLKSHGKRIRAIRVDVTNRAEMTIAAQETLRVFGKIHVLVNNAGVGPMAPLSIATFDDWDWCIGVNVGGVFNGIRTFLPLIKAHNEGGQIVSTSSLLGGIIVGPFWGVYSTSKFAVTGMMEALRSELAHTNIGVSVFCPAGVATNMGQTERNRPTALAEVSTPDANATLLMQRFNGELQRVFSEAGDSPPLMSALEAGQRVLQGIRNNDLYILSHSEYEQAIRDRNDALLASIHIGCDEQSAPRRAIAQLARNAIYLNETRRKLSTREDRGEPTRGYAPL
jgi:NAD(P)-dependent dehydrogenase (short-subunit alcohol dehydrogenase family)